MELSELLKIAPFQGMDEDSLIAFLFAAPNSLKRYAPGDIIAMQGDRCKGLYTLASGGVRACMVNGEGKEITIEEIKAPAQLAPAFIFASENRFPVMIVATEPCELFFVGRERFMQAMHSSHLMMSNFLTDISDRSVFLSKKVSEFALLDLKKRIMRYLETHGAIRNQREVAQRLGVTRPSLARALAELAKEGRLGGRPAQGQA